MMGESEININSRTITISSQIITYGNEATEEVTERIRREIETMWNEPKASIYLRNDYHKILFRITSAIKKDISESDILQNTDPRNNYFRIEKFAHGSISFVDGLGCNTGYFCLKI